MFSIFNQAYQFIIRTVVILLSTMVTLLLVGISYFIFDDPALYIPIFISGAIISVLIGSYLFTILSIPIRLTQEFDDIKNKVADRQYESLQDFQTEIANFMISFFNYTGADITGGKFHFKGCEPLLVECGADFNPNHLDYTEFVKTKSGAKHSAYYVPIQFGDRDLGYMILLVKGHTVPFFSSILRDFENYYLDDQIVHFMYRG